MILLAARSSHFLNRDKHALCSSPACVLKIFFKWKYFQMVTPIQNLVRTNYFTQKLSERKKDNYGNFNALCIEANGDVYI